MKVIIALGIILIIGVVVLGAKSSFGISIKEKIGFLVAILIFGGIIYLLVKPEGTDEYKGILDREKFRKYLLERMAEKDSLSSVKFDDAEKSTLLDEKKLTLDFVQFFESGIHAPNIEDRIYAKKFSKEKTRYVCYEIYFKFPKMEKRVNFNINAIWYEANQNEIGKTTLHSNIESQWTSSYHYHSFGWSDYGRWKVGKYYVDIFINDSLMAKDSFEIY